MKRYSTIMSVLLTLALPVAGSCADATKAPEKPEASSVEAIKDSMSKGHMMKGMSSGGAPAVDAADPDPSGKVLETKNAGEYTYSNLQLKNGKKIWVAYAPRETHVGDTLSFKGCLEMRNFQSKALDRVFETILFCGQPEEKPKSAASKMTGKKSVGSGGAVPAAGGKIKVEKASGANAYTVAEVFAKRGTLNGKQVIVKGQVVKVAVGIMDRNWIHLQDGTGSDTQKTHDLVVTSKENAEIGDVVTVSGTLAKDKDFGGGYKYQVIIEKGSLKK
jgi:hypothetical protein